jgi:thiamine biosynthesis lipoprotein
MIGMLTHERPTADAVAPNPPPRLPCSLPAATPASAATPTSPSPPGHRRTDRRLASRHRCLRRAGGQRHAVTRRNHLGGHVHRQHGVQPLVVDVGHHNRVLTYHDLSHPDLDRNDTRHPVDPVDPVEVEPQGVDVTNDHVRILVDGPNDVDHHALVDLGHGFGELGGVMTIATAAFAGFRALGTLVVVGVTEPRRLQAALVETKAELDACDRACSRFRSDSELSTINRISDGRPFSASEWLLDAVAVAAQAAAETEGLVDPTLGAQLIALGYDRSFDQLDPDAGPLAVVARPVEAWGSVVVDRSRRRVTVPAGVMLDLGATAKARGADRAARRAADITSAGVLVSIGGDIALAGRAPDGGWCIRVTDRADTPPDSVQPGQTVSLSHGAMATSGTSVRRWRRDGHVLHHLIDPRTARPSEGPWRTVSACAPTCVQANTASTASILLGEAAPDWLKARHCAARLVDHDGSVTVLGGWPRDEHAPDPLDKEAA